MSELITQQALADAAGVSRQMIRKYVRLGMPSGEGGYDRAACLEWIAAQISNHGHGGKGRGGGRPRGSVATPKPPEAEGYRVAQARRLAAQTELAQIEIDKATAKLLDRDTTLAATRSHLVVVRQTIERSDAAMVKALAAEFGLDVTKTAAARRIVTEHRTKAFTRIAATPLEL